MKSAFAATPLRRDSLRVVPLCSRVVRRRAKRGDLAEARFSIQVSEGWLGGRDSNPDNGVQSAVSYR